MDLNGIFIIIGFPQFDGISGKLSTSINTGSWGCQEFLLQLALVFDLENPGGSSSGDMALDQDLLPM